MIRNLVRTKTDVILLAMNRNRPFLVFLEEESDDLHGDWIDAEVEIDGLVWTTTDSGNRPTGFRLHVPDRRHLRILKPGNPDPFTRPLVSAETLRSITNGTDARVRFRGVLQAVDGYGNHLHLLSDLGPVKATLVSSLSATVLPAHPIRQDPSFREVRPPHSGWPIPGDVVEVVGAPWPDAPFPPRLTSAEFRVVGRDAAPAPVTIRFQDGLEPAMDGRLVRISARSLDRTLTTAGRTNITQLWLQSDGQVFEARLESTNGVPIDIPDGSLVEATGVCLPVLGERRKPRGIRLVLRDPADVAVVEDTFGWLSGRAVKILGATAAVVLAALIWIGLLHRVVKRQTAEIKASEARLRQSENRFRTVFRSSPAMMTLTRLEDSTFVAVNDAFLQATGYSDSEVTGRPFSAINIYADPAQRTEFLEILRRDGCVRDREHVVLRKDGSSFTALVNGELIEIDGKQHTLAVGLNITTRKKAEQDTLRALEAERDLGELKSRFVSLVSHEFRTPLGITMSAVELLKNYLDRLSPAKRAELLDDIYSATLRMSSLMEQVLLLGRVESGKVGFKPAPVDLRALADRLVEEVHTAGHHTGEIDVVVEVEDSLDGAEVDEGLLRPILSNLLNNALKYSPPGARVRFSMRRDGHRAEFVIADRGIGIPPEDQSRLFEAFHRASNVEHISGTGLGLLIVKRCVELHQGTVRFESAVGEGTTFTVVIPAFRGNS